MSRVQTLFGYARRLLTKRKSLMRAAQAAIFESQETGYVLLDDKGRVLGLNPAAAGALGKPLHEVLGLPLEKAFPATSDLFDSREGEARRKRMALGDGKARRFYEVKLVFLADAGDVRGQLLCLHDLTPQLRAEALLTGQNQVLERMASGAALRDVLEDVVRLLEKHSPRAFGCVMLPGPSAERLRVAAAPSLLESFKALVDDLPIGPRGGACGAAAFRREHVFSPDLGNDPLWADYREQLSQTQTLRACWSTPVLSAEGHLLATLDLYYLEPPPTELDGQLIQMATRLIRIAVERSLASGELLVERAATEWRLSFDAVDVAIVVQDRAGRICRLNRAARELLGGSFTEIVGQRVEEMGVGQPWNEMVELGKRAFETDRGETAQVRDGSTGRSWDLTVRCFRTAADEERVLIMAREVTEMVRLQESLKTSELMAAMGALVAGVAHEARNPLFGITTCLDVLEKRVGNRFEYQPFLETLRTDIARLNELMKDLLEYGHPAGLVREEASMNEVLSLAVARSGAHARKAGTLLRTFVAPGLPRLLLDRARLAQVFQNLLENAFQHSPRGGTVQVESDLVEVGGKPWVRCRVIDSGSGFREQDLPHIFEPFFSRRQGGTGLGLAIAHRIVTEHGGLVEAGNRPEGGAVLEVRLPC